MSPEHCSSQLLTNNKRFNDLVKFIRSDQEKLFTSEEIVSSFKPSSPDFQRTEEESIFCTSNNEFQNVENFELQFQWFCNTFDPNLSTNASQLLPKLIKLVENANGKILLEQFCVNVSLLLMKGICYYFTGNYEDAILTINSTKDYLKQYGKRCNLNLNHYYAYMSAIWGNLYYIYKAIGKLCEANYSKKKLIINCSFYVNNEFKGAYFGMKALFNELVINDLELVLEYCKLVS